MSDLTPAEREASFERVAKHFHQAYEDLAPVFGYRTREDSAKPWKDVPRQNQLLMTATVKALVEEGVITTATALAPLTARLRGVEGERDQAKIAAKETERKMQKEREYADQCGRETADIEVAKHHAEQRAERYAEALRELTEAVRKRGGSQLLSAYNAAREALTTPDDGD